MEKKLDEQPIKNAGDNAKNDKSDFGINTDMKNNLACPKCSTEILWHMDICPKCHTIRPDAYKDAGLDKNE